jgi:hypothetical protein
MPDALLTWVANHPEAAVAVLALVVSLASSVVFFARQSAMTRRQTALQERVTAIEEERREEERRSRRQADVTLRFDSHEIPGRSAMQLVAGSSFIPTAEIFMVVHNRGPAVARDVDVKLDGGSSQHLPVVPEGMLPLPVLDSGQEFSIRMPVTVAVAVVFDAIVTWQDDEGPKEKHIRGGWS